MLDHLAIRCEAMMWTHYTCRRNEVIRSVYRLFCGEYCMSIACHIHGRSVQEIAENEHAEVRVDTQIKTTSKL